MPLYIITVIIQIAFVVHIVKTKRSTIWIWIVIVLPLAGSIAYFIMEVLPGIVASRTGRTAQRKMGSLINPNKDMNNAATNYSVVDTVENTVTLAHELFDRDEFTKARALYQKCLKGVHEHDPDIMIGVAKSEFGLSHFNESKIILDDVIEKNPDYKNPKAHLLYARTLEAMEQLDLALEEYKVLDNYYLGAQATYRYAMLLKKMGNSELSKHCLEKIVQSSKISGKHYNTLNKEWIKRAKLDISQ